jgi:hypothetical protein
MGGSGGGGGSAGEVSWPSGVQDRYDALLGGPALVAGSSTAWQALHDAQVAIPYDPSKQDYVTPSNYTDEMGLALDAFYHRIEAYDPPDHWGRLFPIAKQRYLDIIENYPIFRTPVPVAVDEIFNIWQMPGPWLDAADKIADSWDVDTEISDNWVDPDLDAPDDIKEDLADESEVDASTNAQRAIVSDQLTADILPRFQAGMRDINAVQSSAFVIGRAVIEGMGQRDVTKFDSDLRYKAFLQRDNLLGQAHMQIDKLNSLNADSKNKSLAQSFIEEGKMVAQAHLQEDKYQAESVADGNKLRSQALIQADKIMGDSAKAKSLINAEMARHGSTLIYQDVDSLVKFSLTNLDVYKAWAGFVVDAQRIGYVMQKETYDTKNEHVVKDARWDLDMVQVAGNLIASISGGTSYTPGPTPAQNALGGAFAGAAIGARATGGSGYGAAGGAILGGIGAYLLGR